MNWEFGVNPWVLILLLRLCFRYQKVACVKFGLDSICDFVNSIKSNRIAKENYIEKYINASDKFYTWHVEGEIFFYGEYIIFDNQIMIKYDEDFDVLELYIGQIVKEHSNSFKVDGTCFELNKEQMIKKLNDK